MNIFCSDKVNQRHQLLAGPGHDQYVGTRMCITSSIGYGLPLHQIMAYVSANMDEQMLISNSKILFEILT